MSDDNPSQQQEDDRDFEKTVPEHVNKEGTLHQGELGPKARRKHFFSPLDPAYAEAVHRDAAAVEYTDAEEVRCPPSQALPRSLIA